MATPETFPIASSPDIVNARQVVRAKSTQLGFSLIDQTKIVTATSELARNAFEHGGGGVMHVEVIVEGTRRGLRLTFEDKGQGIADINQALSDGYTSGKGMGLGLGGSRRLVNEFEIESKVGEGTRVTITKWKQP
jgi:serine/threonine-protein kinase RsbT